MNIFSQIAEVIKKLFGKASIEEKINAEIAVSQDMLTAIKTWSDCYANKAEWLTSKYRGKHLPAAIAHEIARLVTLEFRSELTGGKRAEYLSTIYNRLVDDAANFTEYACAKGGLMLKPYITDNGITVAYVQADNFFPTAYDSSGNITGCVFVERKIVGKNFYTRLEIHNYTPKLYTVRNKAYMSDNAASLGRAVSLQAVPEWAALQDETPITNAKRPLFCYFKMPGANHIDSNSPLGVSVFANALDAIKDADEQYARLKWEFEGSELAVNVDNTALIINASDKSASAPRLNKRLYRGMEIENLYEVFSPTIRDGSIINGLDNILRDVEFLSGLAYGTFSRVDNSPKTAAEIKTSRQRSYSTVSAIQRALRVSLEDLLECFNVLCDLYGLAPNDKVEQSFEFDDSLITDTETEQKIWLQECSAGLMTPIEYRMRRYGETEQQAKKALPDAFGEGDKE